MLTREVTAARSRLARLYANGGNPTASQVREARAALEAAKIRAHIAAVRTELSPEQRAELANCLLAG